MKNQFRCILHLLSIIDQLKPAIQTEQFFYIALDVYSLYAHSFVGAFTAISRSPCTSFCHLQYEHCGEDRKHVWIWLYVEWSPLLLVYT